MLSTLVGHVLVAEDNEVNIAVIEGMLEELGCSYTTVRGGREAIARVRGGSYDLVLMDMRMPDIDGVAATRLIRSGEDPQQHTPIIALTADSDAANRVACLDAGMDDFLTKPITLSALHTGLARWLDERARDELAPRTTHDPRFAPEALEKLANLSTHSRAEFLNKVVTLFATTSARQIDQIQAALASEDFAALRALCHSLKSASAHVGAIEVSRLAAGLEQAAEQRDAARAERLAAQVALAASSARDELALQARRIAS